MKCKFKKVRTTEKKQQLKAQIKTVAWIVVTPLLFCAVAIYQAFNRKKETN